MRSSEHQRVLRAAQRKTLLRLARRSVEHGLEHANPLELDPSTYDRDLQTIRASFVTLKTDGQLRGCIGQLNATRPLIVDVSENAFAAAFRDPRFSPLAASEWPRVSIQLSILSVPEPIDFRDENDLIAQLRPGEDGVILRDGRNQGTFLPSVWESLPEPTDFLMHLKRKAGLAIDHWSNQMHIERYATESFGDDAGV